MGYDRVELKITARLSRHNSEEDRVDDERWRDLIKKVTDLVYGAKYARIDAQVD
jgi:hypothetical protein